MSQPPESAQKLDTTASEKISQFKIVLLGESQVGKSCIVLKFVKGQFHEYQEETIGAAFLTQTVDLDDTTIKFEIWDTAGQERYHSLAPMYYRGAAAAIVVYDITNRDTFQCAKTWVKELQRQASPNIVIALSGNKADLASERVVDHEEAQAFAEENSLLFMETSAKTAMNVNEIFIATGKVLRKMEPVQQQVRTRIIKLPDPPTHHFDLWHTVPLLVFFLGTFAIFAIGFDRKPRLPW